MKRVLMFSYDRRGLGHIRRNLALCKALMKRFSDMTVLLVTGSSMASGLDLPAGVDCVKLPGVCKGQDGVYASRSLRVDVDQVCRMREEILLAATTQFKPDIFFLDTPPWEMLSEIRRCLWYLKESHRSCKIILNIRDILDEPSRVAYLWEQKEILELTEELCDIIFIFGLREVYDPLSEYCFPQRMREKSIFCGYIPRETDGIAPSMPNENLPRKQRVLVTVGGGIDGAEVIESYLQSIPLIRERADVASTIILGPEMKTCDKDRLLQLPHALDYVRFIDYCANPLALMAAADLVISMAGYNTLNEIAWLNKKSIVVPRIRPGAEQLIRACCFERLGVLKMLHPLDCSSVKLADMIEKELQAAPPSTTLPFDTFSEFLSTVESIS